MRQGTRRRTRNNRSGWSGCPCERQRKAICLSRTKSLHWIVTYRLLPFSLLPNLLWIKHRWIQNLSTTSNRFDTQILGCKWHWINKIKVVRLTQLNVLIYFARNYSWHRRGISFEIESGIMVIPSDLNSIFESLPISPKTSSCLRGIDLNDKRRVWVR